MIYQEEIFNKKIFENLNKKNKEVVENYLMVNYLNENKLFDKIIDYQLMPYRIEIEPNTKCFLNCKYCQVPFWNRKELPDMDFSTFKAIIDKIPHMLEVKIQGQGEPLLNKDFFNMVNYSVDNNIIVRTYTNGVLLDQKNCEKLIESGIFEVRISIDGAYEKTVEKLRLGVKYDELINNIKRLIETRGRKTFPLINLWMVASKDNFLEIPNLVELGKELGVDGVMVQTIIHCKSDVEKANIKKGLVNLKNKENMDIIEDAKRRAEKLDILLKIHNNIRSKDNPCYSILNVGVISADGYVLPCYMVNNPATMNFGNILHQSISEIFNGHKYNEFRKNVLKCNLENIAFCENCFQ